MQLLTLKIEIGRIIILFFIGYTSNNNQKLLLILGEKYN